MISATEKRTWATAGAAAAIIVVALAFLFRVPSPPVVVPTPGVPPADASRPAPVQLAKPTATRDAVLRDIMALRDLQPLFLPTEHNASLREPKLEPGRTFLDDETLKWHFPQAEVKLVEALPDPVLVNGQPLEAATVLDALDATSAGPATPAFGRRPVTVQPLPTRAGFIEVFSASTGKRVLAGELPAAARPRSTKPWAPLELLAAVEPAGLTGPLVVTEGSRVEEIDAHFRVFLAQDFRLGERLEPGIYRVVVAP